MCEKNPLNHHAIEMVPATIVAGVLAFDANNRPVRNWQVDAIADADLTFANLVEGGIYRIHFTANAPAATWTLPADAFYLPGRTSTIDLTWTGNDTRVLTVAVIGNETFLFWETIDPSGLPYTPENVANKDADSTFAANSDIKYPSQKAVKTALALKADIEAAADSGTVLFFTEDAVYGTTGAPETTNITADVTGAKAGVTVLLIHNASGIPTFSGEFKKYSGSRNYVPDVINYIYCQYIDATHIVYSIDHLE